MAFEIDESTFEAELALSKSSSGWKKRPAWVRVLFLGSGRVQMGSYQHILVERAAVAAGAMFVIVGMLGTNGTFLAASAKASLLLSGSLMFLVAYLMSLAIRIGDRHSVWPWIEARED